MILVILLFQRLKYAGEFPRLLSNYIRGKDIENPKLTQVRGSGQYPDDNHPLSLQNEKLSN